MEFQIKNDIFSRFVGLIRTISEEGQIAIESNGISCILVDPAHVALANVNLKGFEFFDNPEGLDSINVNIEKLGKILKIGSGDDIVTVKVATDSPDMMITIGNLRRSMRMIDRVEPPKRPDLKLPNKITMSTDNLKRAIKAIDFTDYISFDAESENVFFMRSEGDMDRMELELGKDDLVDYSFEATAQSQFTLEYFRRVLDYLPKEINLHMGDAYPMNLTFDDGKLTGEVLVAPRIED